MRHRIIPVVVCLILLVSLGLTSAPAQALQLCGLTQFADTVTLSVSQDPGPQLVLSSNWVQTVPNLYDLTGPGTIIQKFLPQQVFVGSGMLGNTSELFGGNPVCRVTPTIEVENAELKVFTGTLVLLCVAGPSGPFQVTLDVILAPCQEPAFPGASALQQQLLQRPGQDVPLDQRRVAGDERNNEHVQP